MYSTKGKPSGLIALGACVLFIVAFGLVSGALGGRWLTNTRESADYAGNPITIDTYVTLSKFCTKFGDEDTACDTMNTTYYCLSSHNSTVMCKFARASESNLALLIVVLVVTLIIAAFALFAPFRCLKIHRFFTPAASLLCVVLLSVGLGVYSSAVSSYTSEFVSPIVYSKGSGYGCHIAAIVFVILGALVSSFGTFFK